MKQQILRELDETGLLTGVIVNRALLANDRAKYLLTLLQLAFEQARRPRTDPDNLSEERLAVDLDDAQLDAVIPSAAPGRNGDVSIPGAGRVVELLARSCREMLEPISLAEAPEGAGLAGRLDALIDRDFEVDENALPEEWLEDLTRGIRTGRDSIHLYVMDAHRVINRIQRELTQVHVDGVPCVGVAEEDHDLVRAFAAGVRRTRHLKLDHPGLDTTAGRYAGRLVIQNDVGMTDSHVIVIGISGKDVRITYTDVHGRRLAFFKNLLRSLCPSWKETVTRSSSRLEEGEQYYLLQGTIEASEESEQAACLDHIGSRLVFLIDWNKARKRLRNFLPNKAAIRVLETAAEDGIGHMAFLKLGGDQLIYQALDVAAADRLRYGEPLHSAIGSEVAEGCFVEVLRIACEGIANDDSIQVVRDRIISVFTRALSERASGILGDCRVQAGLVVEASLTLHHVLRALRVDEGAFPLLLRSQKRVERWENDADQILNQVRRKEARQPGSLPVRELSGAIDDALDAIDRAMFFLGRQRPGRPLAREPFLKGLTELASLLVRCAQEFYKAIAAVSEGSARRTQDDLPDFFESIGRLDHLSKLKDAQEREYLDGLFESNETAGHIERWREIGTRISAAVDDLGGAGFLLYDSIFNPGQIGA